MTQLTQTQTQGHTQAGYPTRTVASIALAAVLLGGIVGSGVQALTQKSSGGTPVLSARDQVTLKAAQEWEARYREMYPNSR